MRRVRTIVLAGSLLAAGLLPAEEISPRLAPASAQEPAITVEAALLTIPRGQLPREGECRIWNPGQPATNQPPPGRCATLMREVPPGAWLVQRPTWDRGLFRVEVYHPSRPGRTVAVRLYEAETRLFVGEEKQR